MLENNKIRKNRTTSTCCVGGAPSSDPSVPSSGNGFTGKSTISTQKRKRRPAGTPDPDAVVISLSPKTLLESDRYICEICNQGFQRDQNLQMHRRRHKVPWKLLKRENNNKEANKKRVYVCPEPSCVHHDPSHALGDLVGIKKHFRRKHSTNKQWVCDKCNKGYAVQSDYKAHLKTCGTRGHSCDCGRVFSRVESFIEHQDSCSSRQVIHPHHHHPSESNINNLNITTPLIGFPVPNPNFQRPSHNHQNLEILQLLPVKTCETDLRLSTEEAGYGGNRSSEIIAMAEMEFANAKRIRKQAQAELEKARVLEDEIMKITYCQDCRRLNVK